MKPHRSTSRKLTGIAKITGPNLGMVGETAGPLPLVATLMVATMMEEPYIYINQEKDRFRDVVQCVVKAQMENLR